MKKFLLFALLFGSCLLLLNWVGAWVLDRVYERIRVGQKGGLVNTYLALPKPPPVLLMGNSCLGCNVNPDSLHLRAFSIAHSGTHQIFQTGLLSLLQEQHKLPPTVVLHVDLHEYVAPTYLEDITNLKHYYGQAPYITEYHRELSHWEPLKFRFDLYRYNGLLFSLVKNWRQHPPSTLKEGYTPTPPAPHDSLRTVYTAREMRQHTASLNREALRFLQDFIALCRANNVRLVCFTSPYYQTPPWLPEASALIDSLLRVERVPYLNLALRPVPGLAGHARYWRDDTHFNTRGIPLYSQALARHLAEVLDCPSELPAPKKAAPASQQALSRPLGRASWAR